MASFGKLAQQDGSCQRRKREDSVMHVDGHCDPRFARVREAFATSIARGLEHGGGVSVILGGKTVVDLWGGYADAARTRAWRRDTLINIWSSGKGVIALAIAMLVERGGFADPGAEIGFGYVTNRMLG